MDKYYVFGHRNPDTDSVVSAISLAYLKRKLGYDAIPCVLSSINQETSYVLNYFNEKVPMFLNDVKTKVKDLDYLKDFYVKENVSIYEAFMKMSKNDVSKIPVVDKNRVLIGMLSMTSISYRAISENTFNIKTQYKDIINIINGTKVKEIDNIIEGKLRTCNNHDKYTPKDICIINNNNKLNDLIQKKVKMIIITDNMDITNININAYNTNIIKTNLTMIEVINKMIFCTEAKQLVNNFRVYPIDKNLDFSDFVKIANKTRYSYYPVINKDNQCMGLIKFSNVGYSNKKKVILVDHNSYEQSAIGLEEAEIIEIIDHHNISNIGTNMPITFRNIPVGSTSTIIYSMYKENNIGIPKKMAGLMLSGILSDTLILNSPTTTTFDRDAVNHLSQIAGVDYKEYGFNMISAGSSLKNKTKEEILYTDFKKYPTKDGKIGLGQVYTTNISEIEKDKEEFIKLFDDIAYRNDYKFICLFITDIIKNGTYVIYSTNAKETLDLAFSCNVEECHFFPNILSRKLQILPSILEAME